MNDRDWESLVWGLRQGNCVLLLGDEAGGQSERARRDELTRQLKAELRVQPPDGLDLPQIAWLYQSENSRNDLLSKIDRFYSTWDSAPLPVHLLLAQVPFRCIVTSCQDRSMQLALERAPKTPLVSEYEFRGTPRQLAGNWDAQSPLLYHLFGSLSRPKSLVLTEQDLVDFIVAIVSQNPGLPEALRAELRDPEKMFLFLGFGVRNWYPRVLLQVLKAQGGNSRSFALEEFPPPADLGRGIFFYRHGYKVDVFDSSVTEFVDQLRQRAAAILPPPGEAPQRAPGISVPEGPRSTVFICHDHADADLARRVAALLRENGLEPWLDKQSLEVGDQWNAQIEERINDVDYFVILVTPALVARDESVAFEELSIAMRRVPRLRSRRFILPLLTDSATILDELKELHQGPVRGAAGEEPLVLTSATEKEVIERLASSIRRDIQRRMKKGA